MNSTGFSLNDPLTLNYPDQDNNDSDDQQEVNKSTGVIAKIAYKPSDDQYCDNDV